MPKVPTKQDREIAAGVKLQEVFVDVSGWNVSARGNLYRKWRGLLLTIYSRRDQYGWCISAGDNEPGFSASLFDTEAEALNDLAYVIL